MPYPFLEKIMQKSFDMRKFWGADEIFPVTRQAHPDHSKNLFPPEHTARVKATYHKLLRDSRRFIGQRPIWYEYAAQIRYKFEENRYQTNPRRVAELVAKAEHACYYFQHPDPWKNPEQPGGTSWQRYPSFPLHLLDPHAHHPLPKKE